LEYLSTIGLATVLFASTNIDDIFILLGFFSDPAYKPRHVVLGQYLGIAALVAVSIVASLISLVLPPTYVGLLGLLPVVIGIKKLVELRQDRDNDNESDGGTRLKWRGLGQVGAVAGVTIANGGDNLGIYTPVCATSSLAALVVTVGVFALLVAVWVGFAHWLVNHPSLGAPIRRFGHMVTPFVLMAIGVTVLYEAKSFTLLGL
jgi:cadmium resistance protein CadD (predicted permease)